MGFTDGLGRLLSGKPYFDLNPINDNYNSVNQSQKKYVPELIIDNAEYSFDNSTFYLNIDIKNNSSLELEIVSLKLFSITKVIKLFIRAGELRTINNIYKGNLLKHNNFKYCELFYSTLAGDNFMTTHNIQYESKGDGVYHIKNMRYLGPVRDINGNK